MTEPEDRPKTQDARVLLFLLAGEQYGLDLTRVEEVFELGEEPRRVIGGPEWLSGLINHHGQVVPVVELAALFGLKSAKTAEQALLVDVAGQRLALAVHQIAGIETLSGGGIGVKEQQTWHRGRLLTLLEPEKLEKALARSLTRRRPT